MNTRRIQSGKSYWQEGCDDGKAGKPACPLIKRYPGYINGYVWGKQLREKNEHIKFDIAGRLVGIEELRADLNSAKKVFHYNEFCFTWPVVDALLSKIDELQKEREC
jgi:hypothetical protein